MAVLIVWNLNPQRRCKYKKMQKFLTHKKRGFTLIELLVVIAIIGILATIVLVSLNTARAKARDARRSSDIHQIALAMEMYYDSHKPNVYPTITDGYDALTSIGTEMSVVPTDPTNTGNQQYYFTNAGDATKRYCVWVKLEVPTDTWVISSPSGTKEYVNATEPTTSNCYSL